MLLVPPQPSAPSSLEPGGSAPRTRGWLVGWAAGRMLAPLWLPFLGLVMRFGFGWRIEGVAEVRREYRRLRAAGGPLLICANHLTMIDSALVAWALGSPWWYALHYDALPWNLPERSNFARTRLQRTLVRMLKCLPIHRGGQRGEVADVLAHFTALLASGEAGLVFPEGGRSRSGRVDVDAATYGVGRIVKALPGCRVLTVYVRGERQRSWSRLPRRGDRFHVQLDCFEPRPQHNGLRGTIEITREVLEHLAALERRHFDTTVA